MRTVAERLFEIAHPYAWGQGKKYVNKKQTVQAGGGRKLTLDKIQHHRETDLDLFFTNKPDNRYDLIVTDVDADEEGREHAQRLAKWMCTQWYPGATANVSTNGNGAHVYMWFDREGHSVPECQERLRHLEQNLNNKGKVLYPKIKKVEVKGTMSSDSPYEKWGLLCRIPSGDIPAEGTVQLRFSQIGVFQDLPVKKSAGGTGSHGDYKVNLPDWDYAKVQAEYKSASYYLMTYHVKPTGERKLLSLDFQIALIALSIIAQHPNDDKQLPGELVKHVWKKVSSKLKVERAFDYQRWAAIRNTLTDCGFIEWIDNRYYFSEDEEEKGIAMKWYLKEEFVFSPINKNKSSTTSTQKQEREFHIDNKLLKPNPGNNGLRPVLDLSLRENSFNLALAEERLEAIFT